MFLNLQDLSYFIKRNQVFNIGMFSIISLYYLFMSNFYTKLSNINTVSFTSIYYMNSKHLSDYFLTWVFIYLFLIMVSMFCLIGIKKQMLSWLLLSLMTPLIILLMMSIFAQGHLIKLSLEHNREIESRIIIYQFNKEQLKEYLNFYGIYKDSMTDEEIIDVIAVIILCKTIAELVFLLTMGVKEIYYTWQSAKLAYYFLKIK